MLIPGQGLNISYLKGLAHSVAQADFRVVLIGSRRSSADDAASMQDLAQDVIDVMDHLGVEHAWVGGHAFGGSVARFVSVDHHDRVNGVLLLGVEGEVPAAPFTEVPERFRDADVEIVQRAARETWQVPPLAPDVPVLVIHGTEDPITPPANGEDLQASAPERVSVVRIEGGGQLFPVMQVGATSWAIEDYLDWD